MDLGITGRVALVAAASKGLGKACALGLSAQGCRVSLCARDPGALAQARGEIIAAHPRADVLTCVADVAKADELASWVERSAASLGPADILVTNTGGPPAARFAELTEAQWQSGIDSTLLSVVRLCRLVLPEMQRRKWGRVVHLTSFVAKQPVPLLTISSTLRAGLSALTKTLADQVGPDGVTVNAVLSGHAMTDRQLHLAEIRMKEQGITKEEYFARAAQEIPLRRLAHAREMADVVTFLCSERAGYVTGVSIPVDGGLSRSTF